MHKFLSFVANRQWSATTDDGGVHGLDHVFGAAVIERARRLGYVYYRIAGGWGVDEGFEITRRGKAALRGVPYIPLWQVPIRWARAKMTR